MLHFPRPNQRVGIDAMAAGIQQLLERLDGMQAQLEEFDNDIAKLQVKKLEMLDGMQALRQDMLGICLTTVADLAEESVRAVEPTDPQERDRLWVVLQQLREPDEVPRMAAYMSLLSLHKDYPPCKVKAACPKGRALLITRDLLLLTVALGKGPLTNQTLKVLLDEAVEKACGRDQMDKVEQSQLSLCFFKVISLGRKREGFADKVRNPNMFGPNVTAEQVDQLFLVYNAVARASPDYVSKNKESRKHRQRSASPSRRACADATSASGHQLAAVPVTASDTMAMPGQLGTHDAPFLRGLGDVAVSESASASMATPNLPPGTWGLDGMWEVGEDLHLTETHLTEQDPSWGVPMSWEHANGSLAWPAASQYSMDEGQYSMDEGYWEL